MSEWARTTPRVFLPIILARLVTITGLDQTRIAITVLEPEKVPLFAATQDVLVRVMDEVPNEGVIDGGGRWENWRTRFLQISVRTRVQLDPAGQNLVQLTDASLGHLALEDLVIEAMELFSTPGDNGDVLTAPLRTGRFAKPEQMKQNPAWVYSTCDVEALYRRELLTSLEAQFGS